MGTLDLAIAEVILGFTTREGHGYSDKTVQQFTDKVNWTLTRGRGCAIWTAGTNPDGYGKLLVNRKWIKSHRLSYEIFVGDIPEGLCVLHYCDTPSCVNPYHLRLGTHLDNMRDKVKKGRQNCARGEKHGFALLNESDVREIRELCSHGLSQRVIADRFSVSVRTVSHINCRTTWGHIC